MTNEGDEESNYGFTGEWTDGTGLQHLRARYLDTNVGRFTTKDTWGGDYNWPMSLNGWMYVAGNPVNWVDPTGHIISTEICEDWGECFYSIKGGTAPSPSPPPPPHKDPPRKPPIDDDSPGVYTPTPNPYDFGPLGTIAEQLTQADMNPQCMMGAGVGGLYSLLMPYEDGDNDNTSNPFYYDTLTATYSGIFKPILVGGEGDVNFSLNWAAVKNLFATGDLESFIEEFDLSITLSVSASAGISAQVSPGFVTVSGSNEPVNSLYGITSVAQDEWSYNLTGCWPNPPFCIGYFPTYDDHLFGDGQMTSVGFGAGAGEGIDVSFDVFTVEDYLFYAHPGKEEMWLNLPLLNKRFYDKVIKPIIDPVLDIFE